jgi:hypothetical protein
MLAGETILSGAPQTCEDCGVNITELSIYQSGAGFYIGAYCDCGPYSRESVYFPDRESAEKALKDEPVDLKNIGFYTWERN